MSSLDTSGLNGDLRFDETFVEKRVEVDARKSGTFLVDSSFPTEPEACAAFDELIESSRAFKLYREVIGEYVQPPIGTEHRTARIDRILVPMPPALEAGWTDGAIGVELKSSVKMLSDFGPVAAQAIDYRRCMFTIKNGAFSMNIIPSWIFLFPVEKIFGPLASILTQNRVGRCYFEYKRSLLRFGSDSVRCLDLYRDGKVWAAPLNSGKKRGSR